MPEDEKNEVERANQEGGPYADAHPDRPNSGEAPSDAEVTEEMLEAVERKRAYGAGGANPQGAVMDIDMGDLSMVRTGTDDLDELDEQIENEADPVKRAIKAAERDQMANRVFKLQADREAQAEIGEGVERVNDPGDARGQLTRAAAEQGGGARQSNADRDAETESKPVPGSGNRAGARGQEKAQESRDRNADRKAQRDQEKAQSKAQRDQDKAERKAGRGEQEQSEETSGQTVQGSGSASI